MDPWPFVQRAGGGPPPRTRLLRGMAVEHDLIDPLLDAVDQTLLAALPSKGARDSAVYGQRPEHEEDDLRPPIQ
jgi:hypothetical protein